MYIKKMQMVYQTSLHLIPVRKNSKGPPDRHNSHGVAYSFYDGTYSFYDEHTSLTFDIILAII